MGIAFSHGKASWSYSGFMDFRVKLAKEIGIDLIEMEGFEYVRRDMRGIEKSVPSKPWGGIKDNIVPFLVHSDCDGHLTPKQCAKIAPRIKELTAKWEAGDYDKQNADWLVLGMEECIKENKKLEFT